MNSPARMRRLFLALWPSAELRKAMVQESQDIVLGAGGQPIPAENLHLTLAFLGAVADPRCKEILESLRETKLPTVDLTLDRIAWWPRQEIICFEPAAPPEALSQSVDQLHAALREQGFSIERRAFRPHVTLARDVRRERAAKSVRPLRWQVGRFELIESRPSIHGSIYTVLGG